jgi:hypothetical protein
VEAADRDLNSGSPERPRNVEGARILVRLDADERNQAKTIVTRKRAMSAGTSMRVLVSSITSISMSTSGPRTRRSAQSAAMPYKAASEFDGIGVRHQRIT